MKANLRLAACLLIFPAIGSADGGPSARTAAHALSASQNHAGRQLVYVSGTRGMDQPLGWRLITRDPNTGTFAEHYSQGGRIVGTKRAAPMNAQPILSKRWAIDSTSAFSIAEKAAKKAKVGFDAVDYELRCLELSDRPVWFLVMLNSAGARSGEISVAADNGAILRKVWYPAGRVVPQSKPATPPQAPQYAPARTKPAPTAPPPPQTPQQYGRSGIFDRSGGSAPRTDGIRDTVGQVGQKVRGFFGRIFSGGSESEAEPASGANPYSYVPGPGSAPYFVPGR